MALITDRFVFIHVPRTGGHFLRDVLAQLSIEGDETGDNTMPNIIRYHHSYAEVPGDKKKRCFSFGFVRHPVEWVKSLWRRDVNVRAPLPEEIGIVNFVDEDFDKYLWNVVSQVPHAPTIEMLGRLAGCSYIGRYEDLHHEIATILQHLGYVVSYQDTLDLLDRMPRSFVGPGVCPHDVNDEQRARIMAANQELCRRFNYT